MREGGGREGMEGSRREEGRNGGRDAWRKGRMKGGGRGSEGGRE